MQGSQSLMASIEMIRRQASLFDTDRQAVIATTVQGQIVYWSRAAERIYGWTLEEVEGRQILDVTPTSISKKRAEMIMTVLQRGRGWSGTFDVRTKKGDEFTAFVRDVPVRDDLGELLGIVGVSAEWRPPEWQTTPGR